jgi:hypothetical protein
VVVAIASAGTLTVEVEVREVQAVERLAETDCEIPRGPADRGTCSRPGVCMRCAWPVRRPGAFQAVATVDDRDAEPLPALDLGK